MEGVQRREGLYGFEFRDLDKRRLPEGVRRSFDIKQLWQRNHEIINLAVKGFNNIAIAEIMNVTPDTVSNTLNSELGQRKLSELRKGRDEEAKKVAEKIRVLTSKALATYHEIFDDESGECNMRDKKAVADTVVLELSGLRAPTKIHSLNASYQLTKDELEKFKERGMKAVNDAEVIDTVPEDA